MEYRCCCTTLGRQVRCLTRRSEKRSWIKKKSCCQLRSRSMVSKNTPPRLGRGLAALLGDVAMAPSPERGAPVGRSPMDRIDANPFQPRSDFDSAELESLAESIRVQG